MKTSTSINCFFDDTFSIPVETQIQRTYDAGFRTMDMNFWDWCHSPSSPFTGKNWKKWVEGIAETAARLNVRFTQAHAHVYSFYEEPDAVQKQELYRRCIEGASMLNIPWMVFHPSQLPVPEEGDEQMIRDNIAYFTPYAEMGAKLGVGIALENMPHAKHGIITAEKLAELIDGFGMPNVGACWDTGHGHIGKQNQGDSIRTLGSRLHALHVQDNDGLSDQHTAPYYGTIDWKDVAAALADIRYTGDFTFEAHTLIRRVPEWAKADAERLLYQIGEAIVQGKA